MERVPLAQVHNMPRFCAPYNERFERSYHAYGRQCAQFIARRHPGSDNLVFINDYQKGGVALPLLHLGIRSLMFWHVPFPELEHIDSLGVVPLARTVRSMLGADAIGVHTLDYAVNILNFVRRFVPGYTVNENTLTVRHELTKRQTQLVPAPLGIDYEYWHGLAKDGEAVAPYFDDDPTQEMVPNNWLEERDATDPVVRYWRAAGKKVTKVIRVPDELTVGVGVERADLTKGVPERIDEIDIFFQDNPDMVGRIVFVFFVQETRANVAQFAATWQRVNDCYRRLQAKYGTPEWQPIVWVKEMVPQEQLAPWYRRSDLMLVTPFYDGLNLTILEAAAGRSMRRPGVLLLSTTAGAYQQLKQAVVPIHPGSRGQMAKAIEDAIRMGRIRTSWTDGNRQADRSRQLDRPLVDQPDSASPRGQRRSA